MVRPGAGDMQRAAPGVDHRALGAAGHDQCLHLGHDVGGRHTGLLLQHAPFIVIDRHPIGLRDESLQFLAAEHRQPLAWVENERNTRGRELLRMLDHGLAAVRSDQSDRDLIRDVGEGVGDRVEMGILHRARVKCRDLVIVQVRGNERLRGERLGNLPDVIHGHPMGHQPVPIRAEIVSGGGHRDAGIAEQVQAVGDVRRTSAEFAPHLGHQEGHVQDVDLVRENVRLEAVRKQQYRVVSHRTADQRGFTARRFPRHPTSSGSKRLFYR